jgi:myxalamid-type polyketide synthase MxaB
MFQRRAEGLPGQTINWGAWASVGMAAGLSKAMQKKLTARGASMVSVRSSLAALGYLLRHDVAQAGFAKVDWARFQRGVRLGGPARVLEHVIESAASGKSRASESPSAFRARLDAAPMADRRRVLTEHFRGQLAHMLGFPSPDRVQPRHRLYDLGLDSLSAVELRNHTEAAIGRPLPATLLFDFPTLEALVNHLHDEVLGSAALQ